MLEVLSPAGSSDALVAAVQNGADAVYLGYGSFNARMNAKNFTEEQLRQAVAYCHIRGVKVYLTMNTLVLDREMAEAASVAAMAQKVGVDAVIVQDFGVVKAIRQAAPGLPIHASTQMSVHNVAGAKKAAQMGINRVVVARELNYNQIAAICREAPVEVEVFVHGALCMCYSGQCYMSAMIGRRSGNRGQCAQPCRMVYGYDRPENRYPLSLKDNCLLQHLRHLSDLGVASLKIEGRMKRAEYVAIATKLYKDAVLGRPVTQQDYHDLQKVFSRQGFTDGYFVGRKGKDMFGIRGEDESDRNLMARLRATYENSEAQRVPITCSMEVRYGLPATLTVQDGDGNAATVQGPVPEDALRAQLTPETLAPRLSKTGGTPYYVTKVTSLVEPGLMLSAAAINAMRREALGLLTIQRGQVRPQAQGAFQGFSAFSGSREKPALTVQVYSLTQITKKLLALRPEIIYFPLSAAEGNEAYLEALSRQVHLVPFLPRVVKEGEWDSILETLAKLRPMGVTHVLVGNLGMIDPIHDAGFQVRGDFGLNVFNSGSADYLAEQGFQSLTASFELTLPQIRDLSKPIPVEMIAYGRLPLMVTENCIISQRSGNCICGSTTTHLVDRTGSRFPIIRDPGTCRSLLLNSRKLYLGDKIQNLQSLGLWAIRLLFTTENAQQVDAVLGDYQTGAAFDPGTSTRGLYARGVE